MKEGNDHRWYDTWNDWEIPKVSNSGIVVVVHLTQVRTFRMVKRTGGHYWSKVMGQGLVYMSPWYENNFWRIRELVWKTNFWRIGMKNQFLKDPGVIRLSLFCLLWIDIALYVYYESLKRELKTKPINECRCDKRLKTRVQESTRLACPCLLWIIKARTKDKKLYMDFGVMKD